jgi:tetratricopeptide (TPR) repeat protein
LKNEIENIISLVENKNIDLAEVKILNLINKNNKNELYYNIYGVILLKKKNFELAEVNLKKAVKINPNYVEALNNLGLVLKDQERYNEALEIFNKAIKLDNNFSILYNNKGIILKNLGKIDESIVNYKLALSIDPKYFDAFNNLGISYDKIDNFDFAISAFESAVNINPNYFEAYNNLGSVYAKKKNYLNAIKNYKIALNINPLYEDAAHNLGHTYYLINNLEEAFRAVELALKIDPNFADALNTLGMIYYKLGKIDIARENYLKAIRINQRLYKARYNLGVLMIRSGEYEKGWIERETKRVDEMDLIKNNVKKLWDGKYVDGTLYIWREQGVGDEISFSSSLISLSAMAKQVVVEVDERIVNLISRFFINKKINNIQVIGFDIKKPETIQKNINKYTKHFSIGSLGLYLLNNKQKFLSVEFPYLISDSLTNSNYNSKINKNNFNIGLSWRTGNLEELYRNVDLQEFKDVFGIKNVEFYNLQFTECNKEITQVENKFNIKIKSFSEIDYKNNIEAVASLISNLDLVITIQNAVAHISCALGKETWVLVPTFCRNNWGVRGKTCDWYKTAVTYRQEEPHLWGSVMSEVYRDLMIKLKKIY